VIDARGLTMRYGMVHALDDATFQAGKGEVVGLLGSNGAGKTTTMRILTTFLVPTAGTATVAGFDVVREPLEARRRIGYLPESVPLYLALEVRECLNFVGRARGLRGSALKERVRWVVEKCALDTMFHTPVLHLSKGYRQRVALAQALIHDPDVVILDEPTTGLDPHQIMEIRDLIRELAKTRCVVLSTHILQEANALADRLIVMSAGRIVGVGRADELLTQAGVRPRVRLVLAHPAADAAGELRALAGVRELRATGDVLFEMQEDAPGLAERIGAMAHVKGWTIAELSRTPGSLEEMFLELTREAAVVAAPVAPTVPPTSPAGEVAA
jgi:ABC-2 type transport system ATP-binding protein